MPQSHIILTQTFLDKELLAKALGVNFFQKQQKSFSIRDLRVNEKDLEHTWQHYLSARQIIVTDLHSKKDFTASLLGFYEVYSQPTLLFLGDLSQYSLPLQEGMLKLLEEPPTNLHIILFAKDRSNILPTISSRCQFHSLTKEIVIQLLDKNLLEKTQVKLPKVAEFIKQFLSQTSFNLPETKNLEREEIDFWLWQVASYLEEFYKTQPQEIFLQKLAKVLQARKLNEQNLQKKFALGWLK